MWRGHRKQEWEQEQERLRLQRGKLINTANKEIPVWSLVWWFRPAIDAISAEKLKNEWKEHIRHSSPRRYHVELDEPPCWALSESPTTDSWARIRQLWFEMQTFGVICFAVPRCTLTNAPPTFHSHFSTSSFFLSRIKAIHLIGRGWNLRPSPFLPH